jgi:hypothetical protein
MEIGDQRHALAPLPPGEYPVAIVCEAGSASGTVWTGAENLAATGTRSPDRPVRNSRYTDWTIPAHQIRVACVFLIC